MPSTEKNRGKLFKSAAGTLLAAGLLLWPLPVSAQDPSASPPVSYAPDGSAPLPPALSIDPIAPGSSPLERSKPSSDSSGLASLGLITETADLAALESILRDNDPQRRLDWAIGRQGLGGGLEADGQGRLRRLDLEERSLTGRLSLKGLAGLIEFRSRGNPLNDLELADLPVLRKITVNGAEMELVAKSCFSGLTGAEELDLRANGIGQVEREAFQGLPDLAILNLSDNRLRRLGRQSFSGLERLSELYLDRNRLAELEAGLFSPLPDLAILQLSGNRLAEIGKTMFSGLSRLELLHLDENRLSRISREAFQELKSLKYLDLSDNHLSELDPDTFKSAALAELDLEGNQMPLGAMARLRSGLDPETYIYFREQKDVYFAVRVQLLPRQNHYSLPPGDAWLNGASSYGDLLGSEPDGAEYRPAEAAGQAGRLNFRLPGVYRLTLSNPALGADPDAVSRTGYFIIVDRCPSLDEATAILGSRALAGRLVQSLNKRGYLEAPASNPKLISALKALFWPYRI